MKPDEDAPSRWELEYLDILALTTDVDETAEELLAAFEEGRRLLADVEAGIGAEPADLLNAVLRFRRAEAAFWEAGYHLEKHKAEAERGYSRRHLPTYLAAAKARAGRAKAIADTNRARAEARNREIAEAVRRLTRVEDASDRALAKRLHTRRSNVRRWRK